MSRQVKNKYFERRENLFRKALYIAPIIIIGVVAGFFITLTVNALPSIKEFGLKFLIGKTWDPVHGEFGALPFIVGTLFTSFLALLISTPFSLALALFLGEYYRKGRFSGFFRSMVELLAGIPSVIFGFWAFFYLVPFIRMLEMKLQVPPLGIGIATASIVLAIMIIPYSASLAREVISMVPHEAKEAAYSLGATRFEVIKRIILPSARSGIFAGLVLALGRGLGETMAVTMVIGNANIIPDSIFSPANTMASVIANEFSEATGELYMSSLIEIGLLLFAVSALISVLGRESIKRFGTTT
ncbi:MAG: phosphate ABC transporter permease subunit PstC [Chitinivibrionales bacterium]|nr:phosphate ABC transporter permease subunit PstC [Chitinivibrionales bacterium]